MESSSIGYLGSTYSRLMSSCLVCFVPGSAAQNEGSPREHAVEREMKICHNQPHLVPPMKLVLYDDLPSTRQRSSSHLSQWVAEGKTLASRASSRASVVVKRRASKRPQIGNPQDFRRVNPPLGRVNSFRPLELSIYLPGNRLSPLGGFEDFDIDALGQIQVPERAFVRSRSETLPSQSSNFQIPRKPITSMVSETELSWSRQNSLRQHPVDPNDPYTQSRPSFCESFVSEAITVNTEGSLMMRTRSRSEPAQFRHRASNSQELVPKATLAEPFQDAFSPIMEETGDETASVRTPVPLNPTEIPTTPSTLNLPIQAPATPSPGPSPSNSPTHTRVTQWLFRSPSVSYPTSSAPFYQCSPRSAMTAHTGRTTSVSTVSTMASAGAPTISTFTTLPFSPSSRAEKEDERGLLIVTEQDLVALPPLPPSYEDICPAGGDEAVKEDETQGLRMSRVGLAF